MNLFHIDLHTPITYCSLFQLFLLISSTYQLVGIGGSWAPSKNSRLFRETGPPLDWSKGTGRYVRTIVGEASPEIADSGGSYFRGGANTSRIQPVRVEKPVQRMEKVLEMRSELGNQGTTREPGARTKVSEIWPIRLDQNTDYGSSGQSARSLTNGANEWDRSIVKDSAEYTWPLQRNVRIPRIEGEESLTPRGALQVEEDWPRPEEAAGRGKLAVPRRVRHAQTRASRGGGHGTVFRRQSQSLEAAAAFDVSDNSVDQIREQLPLNGSSRPRTQSRVGVEGGAGMGREGEGEGAERQESDQCQRDCRLVISNLREVQEKFLELTAGDLTNWAATVIHFKVQFSDYSLPLMDTYPYMSPSYSATQWVWAASPHGHRLLSLPADYEVLSLYLLTPPLIPLRIRTFPRRCFVLHSPECRLHEIRHLLINNLTSLATPGYHDDRGSGRSYVCHHVINNTAGGVTSRLMYRCCETRAFIGGDVRCNTYVGQGNNMLAVNTIIYAIAAVATLYSPVALMRMKIALRYDNVMKFFRASLKHGITGQRNYVIRISSRQLIDLSDPSPFSLPRSLFHLLFHCYGEGRCCIHWWGEWAGQPTICRPISACRQGWFILCKIIAILFIYPLIFHMALLLYTPRLPAYYSLLNHTQTLDDHYRPLTLSVSLLASSILPSNHIAASLWTLLSIGSFLYTVTMLSWTQNPLERCLLRYDGGPVLPGGSSAPPAQGQKKAGGRPRRRDEAAAFHDNLVWAYKGILQQLAYGEFRTKRHFFAVACCPWGARRVLYALVRVLSVVPVINVCFSTFLHDVKLCPGQSAGARGGEGEEGSGEDREGRRGREEGGGEGGDGVEDGGQDRDETVGGCSRVKCVAATMCNRSVAVILWAGFLLLLAGYCTSVFLMVDFLLSVVFFVSLGAALHASVILPWFGVLLVVSLYVNDDLSAINSEHRYILKLIDENSPRVSAIEETEEMLRENGVQILKSHNLGAVKFIDGDGTEYVSKELYHAVCADLKQGWGAVTRRVTTRFLFISLYSLFVFIFIDAVAVAVGGSGLIACLFALIGCAIPKIVEVYGDRKEMGGEWGVGIGGGGGGRVGEKRAIWSKIIPDILDRHIRVDHTRCIDPAEEELTTYDVRPIGLMDMDIPRPVVAAGSLQLWKFPWMVSGDQQTQSNEGFVIALANKLSAASFLTRVVTRGYPVDLMDEAVLRQWCLLVETCIVESSASALNVAAGPLDLGSLFPREYHSLVSSFDAGNTIDIVVDEINRQLYYPSTRGVLVTIGNMSFSLIRATDTRIIAFNSSCHGDQVTDVFGAVVIATEFNAQNLQSLIKYLIDPTRPDSVPVYGIVPVEAFSFRSPDIFEMESSI